MIFYTVLVAVGLYASAIQCSTVERLPVEECKSEETAYIIYDENFSNCTMICLTEKPEERYETMKACQLDHQEGDDDEGLETGVQQECYYMRPEEKCEKICDSEGPVNKTISYKTESDCIKNVTMNMRENAEAEVLERHQKEDANATGDFDRKHQDARPPISLPDDPVPFGSFDLPFANPPAPLPPVPGKRQSRPFFPPSPSFPRAPAPPVVPSIPSPPSPPVFRKPFFPRPSQPIVNNPVQFLPPRFPRPPINNNPIRPLPIFNKPIFPVQRPPVQQLPVRPLPPPVKQLPVQPPVQQLPVRPVQPLPPPVPQLPVRPVQPLPPPVSPIFPPTERPIICPPFSIFKECASGCRKTCSNHLAPPKFCTLQCEARCDCIPGYVYHEFKGMCVLPSLC